ncbi:MAG: hypothetical protein U1E56_02255 [Bauldia sp.]
MSLLSICQRALSEIGDTNVPTSIYGNIDPTAVQLLALLTRGGKTLRRFKWQALIKTGTIAVAGGTQDYALPADWLEFDPLTFWDEDAGYDLVGPVSPALWNTLNYSGLVGAGMRKYFRVAAGKISLFPVPTAVATLRYSYRSKYWIGGLAKEDFTDDTDTVDLDEQLLIADLKWRYRQAKGLDDWPVLAEEANRLRDLLLAADGGKASVRFGGAGAVASAGALPESGFGL